MAVQEIKEKAQEALKPLSDNAKRAGDAVRDAAKPVTDAADRVKEAAAPVVEGAKQAGSSFSNIANRMWHFMDGTIRGMLNFTARYGRRGFYVGLFAGIAAMTIPGGVLGIVGLGLPFYGMLAGAVAGATLGAAVGTVRGGIDRLRLEDRKEKYAAELDEQRRARYTTTKRKDGPNTAFAKASEQLDRVQFDRYNQYNEMIDDIQARRRGGGGSGYSFREAIEAERAEGQQETQR